MNHKECERTKLKTFKKLLERVINSNFIDDKIKFGKNKLALC